MGHRTELLKIQAENLQSVAEIHVRAFPESALTRLGAEAVRRYYEWQLTGPHDHEFVGVWRQRNLLGFAVAGISRGAMSGFVRQNAGFLFSRVLMRPWLVCGSRFRGRLRLALRGFSRKKASPQPVPVPAPVRSFGVLAIAVDPACQGEGGGKLLMNHLEKTATERGFERMHLTVAANNQRAISFYERLGWGKVSSGGDWAGRMHKGLSARPARCVVLDK